VNKNELTTGLVDSAESGTLVTPKHDPVSMSVALADFRTVLTPDASSSFIAEMSAGRFTATEYVIAPHTKPCYVIELTGSLTPVGLGFESGSTTPSSRQYDRLLAVSSSKQGWHVYAEAQQELDERVASGSATVVGPLA